MSYVARTATLVYGYTMADIDRLAHDAALKARGAASLIAPEEAREEAWSAIVELLYLCPEKPSEWSLVDAGCRAIGEVVRIWLRDQGLRQVKGQGGGYEDAPRFSSYWGVDDTVPRRGVTTGRIYRIGAKPDWTDAIVERMALPRALATLTPNQYEALVTVAAFMRHADEQYADGGGTALAQAATFMGLNYVAVKKRVHAARKRIMAVWFESETPPGETKKEQGGKCRFGHSRAEHGYRNTAGEWACRICHRAAERRRRARGVRYDTTPKQLEIVDEQPTPLTFAPPPDLDPDEIPTAATTCWCGLLAGHDWPDKDEGAPHPRDAA